MEFKNAKNFVIRACLSWTYIKYRWCLSVLVKSPFSTLTNLWKAPLGSQSKYSSPVKIIHCDIRNFYLVVNTSYTNNAAPMWLTHTSYY